MINFKRYIFLSIFLLLGGCASMQIKPIPVDQVVEMSKSGMPSETIIQSLKKSGTIYKLSAGEVVKLHKQGVPAPVLDYMQSTYVDAVRREEASRAYFYAPPPYWYGRRYYYPGWW